VLKALAALLRFVLGLFQVAAQEDVISMIKSSLRAGTAIAARPASGKKKDTNRYG
jgi:hypothetical protein